LIAHRELKRNVQRASILGLGCAGAIPTLQPVADFVRANPSRKALMLAVEICSACYYVDDTLETVIGNAICADGAAAFLLGTNHQKDCVTSALLTSRRSLIPSRSNRWDFNTATASYESSWEHQSSISRGP
jgi:predicted naringenin-chalcone synthase